MPSTPDTIDIVQVEKQESTALGGDDADSQPYPVPLEPQEDGLEVAAIFLQESGRRDRAVSVWPDSGKLRFRDSENTGSGATLTELLSGSGGLTEGAHEALDSLVHNIDETSYEEITYSGSHIVSVIVWETAAKLKKIREELYTYTGSFVSEIVTNQYDGTGAVAQTVTETYSYSGARITSIDRVKS